MKIVNKKKFIFFLLFIILVLIIVFLGLFFIYARHQVITPLNIDGPEEIFIIEDGEGLKEIAEHLEEADLIRQRIWFVSYIFYKGWTARLQAGQYFLSPNLSIPQIAEKIIKGEAISQEIQVTIPEGFTLKQIDARLASVGLIQSGELINFNPNNVSSFNPQLNWGQVSRLEGFLFPDTYRLSQKVTKEEIIEKMLDNFTRKLTEDLRAEIKRQGKTIFEIVVMASLLEKEVRTDEDRRIVSGIFWKRIRNSYPLQSCATIAYILEIDKWRYSIEDTKVESSYNTYQNIGLPTGPICNPGMSAIKAAIFVQETDYNFFLSKPNGETVFSRTLEEHNENKAKYLQ